MARKPEPTISAVLIVKDEEEYLARCLESVRWVDEIVVYDTGSTDRTVEIARQFTDTVIEGYWNDDFGDARNRALAHATSEWVLIVDADETFEANPRALRKHLAAGKANFFTVTVSTRVAAAGVAHVPVVSVRLFRKADGRYTGALHEQVVPRPEVSMSLRPLPGAAIRHSGYSEGPEAMAVRLRRNLEIAEREVASAEAGSGGTAGLALRQANLARTLSAVGRTEEALALAEQVYREGDLPDEATELFASTMVLTAAHTRDFELARTWARRLRGVLGNPVWADSLLVDIAALEGSAELTLDLLECVPTTVVDHRGRQFRRLDRAGHELWALHRLGRIGEAHGVARRAALAGVVPGHPAQLLEWLGADGVRQMVALLPDDAWQLLGVLCTHAPASPAAHQVLSLMAQARPDDLTPVLCARRLVFASDLAGLEEAASWSARMRTVGLDEHCPLVTIAVGIEVPAAQRARAAALALFAYGDSRALPPLETALAQIAPEDQAELAAQLDVLAPGLVQHA
ncbi:glycosyltransferase family 2 protein [Georgenia sp. H159]|uniref:glycosyltransferase family 2 protein n=1 Tax=Georgenia sp. H159 TaxID=3076115 RepID=UPI002D7966ED|nr:glycosyltransferase family 2 protein [Georgenia sp. H159]